MTVNASSRPNKLIVAGLEFPGFVRYVCDENELDTSGVILAAGTIEIDSHHANPQSLNDRVNRWWCWGKKLEVHILCSDSAYRLHPRGVMYLIRSFYSLEGRLTLQVGCLLSLLKNRSIDDFREDNKIPKEIASTVQEPQDGYTEETALIVISYSSPGVAFSSSSSSSPSPSPAPSPAPTGDLTLPPIFREFQKSKFYNIQSIVTFLLGRAGVTKIYGSVSGKIRGPISFSGSLVQQAGELCFKASPPSYIWADKDTIRITPINITNNPTALVVLIGKDEVEYAPLDSGLDAIKELVLTGNIDKKNTEKPDNATETINSDGSKSKTSITQDFGPETIINFNGNPATEILLATTTTTELIQANQKIVTTIRVERRGLVVPTTKTNRSTFVESFRSTFTQYFSNNPANNGRLDYEEEEIKEPVCKVFAGFLGTYSDVNFTFPLGFETIGGQTFPADSWLLNTTQILSSKTRTNYSYNSKGVQTAKTAVTQEYISKILTTYWPFFGTLAPSKQTTEQWMRWGDNEMHRVTAKTTYQERYSAELEALDEKLWTDKVATGTTEVTSIPTYTRTGDVESSSTIAYSTRNINTFQVKHGTRMSLMTEKDGDKVELSRAGLANAPATEYLPAYSAAGEDGEAVDDWEEEEVKITKYWDFDFGCSGQMPPKEIASIGKVPNQSILSQIADILYFYRQGKSKAYELTIEIGDWWMSGMYRPAIAVQIVEPDNNALTYLLTGLNFSCESDANLILGDLWWIGGTASSLVSSALGNWLETGVRIVDEGATFQVGDRVELGAIGGTIPGIAPDRYWVAAVQIVNGIQQIQLSPTQNGAAVAVTGAIIGQPRITSAVAKEPVLAFSQLKKWLQITPPDWLQTSLNDWLILEVN
ncbi:hypothetical protein QT972_00155 [Microcoleus sp. herbarium7]|uniref:hypothetical protein n=1 Tax=Microcoleus sp. herbarium7 TaxID=3055435 RepID=UPI002FD42B1A